jgi:hypothetical protein
VEELCSYVEEVGCIMYGFWGSYDF